MRDYASIRFSIGAPKSIDMAVGAESSVGYRWIHFYFATQDLHAGLLKSESTCFEILLRVVPSECPSRFVWTISVPVNSTYTLTLNSTVFHSLNTSGIAPRNNPAYAADESPLVQWSTQTLPPAHEAAVKAGG